VLWKNDEYNQLYRALQRSLLADILARHHNAARSVLDIGCGIGIVARMLADLCPQATIDAVDFQEMISIARVENPHERVVYIPSSAEDYHDSNKRYDVVISSGCSSAIRSLPKMNQAMRNAAAMLGPDGIMIMIDPFHRSNFLARAKISSREVVRSMRSAGLRLVHKSGVLFWPYREFLANSQLSGAELQRKFRTGERLLGFLGRHYWADYKILVFKRD
jgi:2-polyprenyl-3-methyl-5-hydroxy-6-metoxy-1,4-benzoquinol methylase